MVISYLNLPDHHGDMHICFEMGIPYFFLFVVFAVGLGEAQNGRDELRCGGGGPAIRFPFRLNSQPHHCGWPGFNLSCTDTKHAVLELPTSVKFFVEKIDYKSQVIEIHDPHHCFPRQLRQLNLSSSPFLFEGGFFKMEYALFNCSSTETQADYAISCLSGPSHEVRAFFKDDDITDLPIASCKKMYTLPSIPISFDTLILGGQNTVSKEIGGDKTLQLKWSRPFCGECEEKGMGCRLKNNSNESETECFPKPAKGLLSKFKIPGIILGSFLLVVAVFALYRLYSYDKAEKQNQEKIKTFLEDYKNFKPTRFSYADLKRITNRFVEKLGEGAYGTVFKGKLSNEIHVAVKMIRNTSIENGEEFINEVGMMGRIHHVNIVRLVGFCADGFRRALVYEFSPNYSFDKFISSADTKNRFLGWNKLQDIAIGIAKGIDYLHEGCDQQILHFDIKPHNVLLDENFNPKISDFGLAKLCSKDKSAVSMTTARGTMGYIAPEVFSRNFGNVSYKSDIYSFGILLLEVVGGRKNVDITTKNNTSQVYFPEWIYNFLEQKEDLRVFIEDDEDAQIANKLAIVGLWCIQWHPANRPSMKVVIQMLEGKHELTMPPNPFASTNTTRMNLNQKLDVISEQE